MYSLTGVRRRCPEERLRYPPDFHEKEKWYLWQLLEMKSCPSFSRKRQPQEPCCCCGKKLKVGIIGTGWIAESHIESYKRMPDVEIVAGADLIPGKAEKFFKRYGVENVRLYPSHKEMLENEELDAVSVCTYNMTHAECTIDALNKGVNVLLEKPMCVTTKEAVEIMRAEKKSGKVLSIGFQPRLDENMKMVKKIVQSGVLGEVYYIQTGGGRRPRHSSEHLY